MDESVLLVGSLAYDTVTSPAGSVENELGGSATYGGLAASFHSRISNGGSVGIVGVVVLMDFIAQVQSHMMSSQYSSLMKKANLKNYRR